MAMKPGYDIEGCKVIQNTGKALLVRNKRCSEFDGEDIWVPQSQITDDSDIWRDGDEGTLTVTEWFAEKKGWME